MNLEQIKSIITTLNVNEKEELYQFLKKSLPKPLTFSIRRSMSNAKSHFNLPKLKIIAYRKEVMQQAKKYGGSISFEDALKSAIQSYLTDGTKSDSPYWLIEQVPDDYGLNYDNNSAENITQVLYDYLNDGHSTIELITSESKFPPEEGEKITDNWVFLLKASRFSASLHWAIVPRNGNKVYNYGYG
jgi:hypothetical protein